MDDLQILQNAPDGATYFGIVEQAVNYPVYLDGVIGTNSCFWVQSEDDGTIWEKVDFDDMCIDALRSIRSLDDIRSLFAKDDEIADLKEEVRDCRDDICHLRSKHNDHG